MSQHARLSDYSRYILSPAGKAILAMASSLRIVDLASLAKAIGLPSAEVHHLLMGTANPVPLRQRRALEDFLGSAAVSLVLPPPGKPGASAAKTPVARLSGHQRAATTAPPGAAPAPIPGARTRTKSSHVTTPVSAVPSLVRRGAAARGRVGAPPPTPSAGKSKATSAAQLARLAALLQQIEERQREMASILTDLARRDPA